MAKNDTGISKKKMSKKKKRIIIGGILLLVVVALVAFNIIRSSDKSVKVLVGDTNKGKLVSLVSGPGTVTPTDSVKVSAYVLGKVVDLPVKEGDIVKAGQLLLRLDDTQYYQQLLRAESALDQASYALELARQQYEEGSAAYKRQQALYDSGLISEQEYEQATTAFKSIESNYDTAQAAYTQAQAAVVTAQDSYSKTRYDSPIDGVITNLNIDKGEVAVPGTMNTAGTVLMEVSNMGTMQVEAEIDEVDVVKVKLGQEANVEIDAYPDEKFKGKVIEIGNSPQSTGTTSLLSSSSTSTDTAVNFIVKVLLEDPPADLRSGMSATVDIITDTRDECLYVPIQSVVKRDPNLTKADIMKMKKNEGQTKMNDENLVEGVFVVQKNEAVFVPVTTGISDDQNYEIISGLSEGDKIITGSYKVLRKLQSGDPVKVVEKLEEEKPK
jgi:HlyD family secretion protein